MTRGWYGTLTIRPRRERYLVPVVAGLVLILALLTIGLGGSLDGIPVSLLCGIIVVLVVGSIAWIATQRIALENNQLILVRGLTTTTISIDDIADAELLTVPRQSRLRGTALRDYVQIRLISMRRPILVPAKAYSREDLSRVVGILVMAHPHATATGRVPQAGR